MVVERPAEMRASSTSGAPLLVEPAALSERRVRWLRLVVLLDYVAALMCFAAAGGYLVLKAYNDQQATLISLAQADDALLYVLHARYRTPLPDHFDFGLFAEPVLANLYLLTMAALHLAAAAGFLMLALALGAFRMWARRVNIALASLALAMLGTFTLLLVMSGMGRYIAYVTGSVMTVPLFVLAVLLAPATARSFATGSGNREAPVERPDLRLPRRGPSLVIGLFALFLLVDLLMVLVASIPIAILCRLAWGESP